MANTFSLAIEKIQVNLDSGMGIVVGQALKAGSQDAIKNTVKQNLRSLLKNSTFQSIAEQLKSCLNENKQKIKKYNNSCVRAQFFAAKNFSENIKTYELNRDAEDIKTYFFRIENLLNNLRSAILGLPNTSFSIGIQNKEGYYFINNKSLQKANQLGYNSVEQLLSSIAKEKINKNTLNVKTHQAKKEMQKVLEILKKNNYFIQLSKHYSNMIRAMRESHYQPEPNSTWTAEVFSQHIQQTGQQNNENFQAGDSWRPHEINEVWRRYHQTAPYYDAEGNLIKLASQTQGGDAGQVLIKNLKFYKSRTSNLNLINLNVLQDTLNFWNSFIFNIKQNDINDNLINLILSVLLSGQTIKELGLKTVADLLNININGAWVTAGRF